MAPNKRRLRGFLFPSPRPAPQADTRFSPLSRFPCSLSIPGLAGSRFFSVLLLLILAACLGAGLPTAVSSELESSELESSELESSEPGCAEPNRKTVRGGAARSSMEIARKGIPEPLGFEKVRLATPPVRINDGDTFEADLDGDGKLSFPRERVRLLFVDTPELTETWKGMDRGHGLPAMEFLREALTRPPIFLLIPKNRATGKYGRTLAVVYAGGCNVNLGLIRAGHAPFDTRFRFPADYARYAKAEGEAFDARRGIWRLPDSRRRYLKRLRRELKTPAGRRNPSFSAGVYRASSFKPRGLLERYVKLEGRVKSGKRFFKQGRLSLLLLQLERGGRKRSFPVVIYRRTAEKLRADLWAAGVRLRLEGFIKTYRGQPQLVVHYGRRID